MSSAIEQGRGKAAIAWAFAFLAVFIGWLLIAWHTQPGMHIRVLDIMDYFTAFNGDDGYRYFFYRQAFSDPQLYTWDYILPVPMLLDGLLVALFDGAVFPVRVAHAVLAFASLFLLYRTQLRLGISRNVAAASVFILALMPVYALHAMSFYGESWLVMFTILLWYFLAAGQPRVAALAASCLPLIRPEGFLLILPLFIYFLKRRQYASFLLLGLLGGIYFFWLLWYLPFDHFKAYFSWHEAYRAYINHIQFPVLNNPFGFFVSYNAFWYVPAVAWFAWRGFRLPGHDWWPWLVGANALFLAAYFALLWSGNLYYEPRYFSLALPMLVICFSLTMQAFSEKAFFRQQPRATATAFVLLLAFIGANHVLQNDELRNRYFFGKRLPFAGERGPIHGFEDDSAEVAKLNELLEVVYAAIEEYPQIGAVFMPAFRDVYYLIDPQRLGGVEFVIVPLNYGAHVGIFGGSLFGWHAGGKQYSYYNFYDMQHGAGKKIGLYFGNMEGCDTCTPLRFIEDMGVYAVYYAERSAPARVPERDEIFIVDPVK